MPDTVDPAAVSAAVSARPLVFSILVLGHGESLRNSLIRLDVAFQFCEGAPGQYPAQGYVCPTMEAVFFVCFELSAQRAVSYEACPRFWGHKPFPAPGELLDAFRWSSR